jgi:hypothetical protein
MAIRRQFFLPLAPHPGRIVLAAPKLWEGGCPRNAVF